MFAVISYPPIPLFEVGPLTMSLHGLFAALGFIAGAFYTTRMLEQRGFSAEAYQSVLSWALVGSLLGARYLTTPAALLDGVPFATAMNPVSGNFSIMGGFAGGILVGWWRMRKVGLDRLPTFDNASYGLAIGTIVGRIGDLAIVEHLGSATDLPWGYGIRPGYDVAPMHNALECSGTPIGVEFCGVYHHVALYDMMGAIVLFFVLFQVQKRFRLHYGQLFSFWVVWYGLQRFILDALRFDSGDATVGAFTWNQVSGLAAALLGVALFVWFGRNQPVVSAANDEARQPLAPA
ncbi:MAG TPA: prolipoprotein diacylglyceryl transferase family protein [Acidimicrobiia bacterium]|nr:prolipoprotein diacylglyceryl transferase family protein [Acidimicrobiia bacterium]